jgi:hypothetical protein
MSAQAKSFLVGTALTDAICDITATGNVDCAVAFWGDGAERMFGNLDGRELRIICNLRMGGTNPAVIARVREFAKVRHYDTLHAKVYLGPNRAVVTSANASTNGLGVNGASPATWVEAGYLTVDTAPIRDWFEGLWRLCKAVTDADLAAAKKAWERRQILANDDSPRDLTPKFADYKVGEHDFPLITWWDTVGAFETNRAVVEAAPPLEHAEFERSIDDGIEIEAEADRPYLSEGRWVLVFVLRHDGQIARQRPWFVRLGRIVDDAGSYGEGGTLMAVALASADHTGRPFDEREPRFIAAFRELIEWQRYADLRNRDYVGAWFAPRIDVMRQFWRDLAKVYREKASVN